MLDGVYSMYGDFAPVKQLVKFLEIYKKLNLYIDDAHGLGWTGKNGKGYFLSQTNLTPRMVLGTSLNKAFAAGGAAFVFQNKDLCEKVKSCGGGFIFSGPHQIAVLGAGIAAAKIFLSDEIYFRQVLIHEKIEYCQNILIKHNLPVISNPETPIFFVGVGSLSVGCKLVKRLFNDGFYVNLSAYPAVPENNTGIRFTITLHHSFEDIRKLAETIAHHFYQALKEEDKTVEDVEKAFRRIVENNRIPRNSNLKESNMI